MNRIINDIKRIIDESIALYLPNVKSSELEDDGAIFYMNGQNGTEFDWFVNGRFPYFMVFYNDEDNMGAVKLALFSTGEVQVYLYDERGKKLVKTVREKLDIDRADMLRAAAILTREADDKKLWDKDIKAVDSAAEISEKELIEFGGREKTHAVMKNRMNICKLFAVVSKRIVEDGWRVGYMERNDSRGRENDSGWFFAAGNEDNEYLSRRENLLLLPIGAVWQRLDRDIFKYIDMPAGTRLIRVSPNEFEADKNDKDIYMVRR